MFPPCRSLCLPAASVSIPQLRDKRPGKASWQTQKRISVSHCDSGLLSDHIYQALEGLRTWLARSRTENPVA